jgi:hypothetical protein
MRERAETESTAYVRGTFDVGSRFVVAERDLPQRSAICPRPEEAIIGTERGSLSHHSGHKTFQPLLLRKRIHEIGGSSHFYPV